MLTFLKSFIGIILSGDGSRKFFFFVTFGMAFSQTVILSTIGLMDGFESALKNSLRSSQGEIVMTQSEGAFLLSSKWIDQLQQKFSVLTSGVYQAQALALKNNQSHAVIIQGITPKSFNELTKQKIKVRGQQLAVGKELALSLGIKTGDDLTLALMTDLSKALTGGAELMKYRVAQIVEHGIYEKDLRYVYLSRKHLLEVMGLKKNLYNALYIGRVGPKKTSLTKLKESLIDENPEYFFEYYWEEFSSLIKAVEVEKFSIGFILQVIVVVSIFNLVAFIIYIMERKAQDFFLLRALGVQLNQIRVAFLSLNLMAWFISLFLAIIMVFCLNLLLIYSPFLQLPGDVYVLGKMQILLSFNDYLIVFSLALAWVVLVSGILLWRFSKKSLITGLRQEFS